MLNLDIRKRCRVGELQKFLQYPWMEPNFIFQDTSSEISSLCRTPNPESNGRSMFAIFFTLVFLLSF